MTAAASVLGDALRDRYVLERELGRGGMATVYLAQDLRHARHVALKVLRPELTATLGPERFLREIRIAAGLTHAHILPVLDSGAADGMLYYVMPYVPGESLRARLQREVQLSAESALDIVSLIADALEYAHGRGIVHRDIKPENILLMENGTPVLADFGLAVAIGAADGQRLTESGLALGTPAYMSPEQAAGEHRVDGRTDIYSLGCVLYELLAGEPPFTGPTAQAIIAKRFGAPAPRIRVVREGVSPAVEHAIERALAKAPADRFATAGEFARALHEPAATPRRHSLIATARWIAGIGLAVLAAAGAMLLRPRAAPPTDPNLLAVAPFDVLEPSLRLWHEGLADMLSRSLDGAGPVRTVSQSVALRRWNGRADRASAEALGRRTGAGLVVFGAVVPRGRDSVSLRAGILDGTGTRGETEVEISGPAARMGELADSLGFKILQTLGRSRPIGSVRNVSIGSKSLPALKAFLQGEQLYRRGLWDSALVHYDQAVAQDSGFALALWRMALVLWWAPATSGAYRDSDEYQRRAVKLNHGLSPRDSLILTADSLDDLGHQSPIAKNRFRAMAVLEEAARRYPSDPEIWYILGEYRYHDSPPLGGIPGPALQAFERAIALDPGFAPAYEHVVQLSMQLGRPDLAKRYARAYTALDLSDVNAPSLRLVALALDSGSVGTRAVTRAIRTASTGALFRAGLEHLASWPDSAETAVSLLRELARGGHAATGSDGGAADWVADSLMWPQYLAAALAFRGHLREAYQTDRRLLLDPAASPYSEFQDPFLSLLGVIPDSAAGAAFRRSLEPGAAWQGDAPRYLRGLPWWLARGDTASLARFARRAVQEASRPQTPGGGLRDRLLGATAAGYLALARGDSTDAVRRLESIPDTLCLAANCFFVKLTLARLLAAQGEYRRADDLLDRWRWATDSPLFVIATLELGRVAERLSQRGKVIGSYRFVSEVWQRADPELQPYVTESRAALARLTKE